VVCITNHSTADGLLHIGPGGIGADTVTNVSKPLEINYHVEMIFGLGA